MAILPKWLKNIFLRAERLKLLHFKSTVVVYRGKTTTTTKIVAVQIFLDLTIERKQHYGKKKKRDR